MKCCIIRRLRDKQWHFQELLKKEETFHIKIYSFRKVRPFMKELIESEKLETLALQLVDEIRHKKDAFSVSTIIIPHKNMEGYFKSVFLKNDAGVLMNVRFLKLEDGLLSLLDMGDNYHIVSKGLLREFLLKYLSMEDNKDEFPDDISSYLYKNGKLDAIQLYDLADSVASLFLDYDKEAIDIIGWQKKVYDEVMRELYSYRKGTLRYLYGHRQGFLEKREKVYFFGFSSFDKTSVDILDAYCEAHDVKCYFLKPSLDKKNEISVLSAPSRMRETEAVHSTICHLLQQPENHYSDFLVLAPGITSYKNEIKRVFSQDNINFPDVPFSINGSIGKDSDLKEGLCKLLEIANKGYYTRLDFYELIHNPMIAQAREISKEEQDEFPEAVLNMNVYRRKDSMDDFDYAKKRLLLSKLVSYQNVDDSLVELEQGSYLPYHTIGMDDDAILHFVNLIDDIDAFIDAVHSFSCITPESLHHISQELSKWFSVLDNHGAETNQDFVKVQNELYRFEEYGLANGNIPLMTLFYSLKDMVLSSSEDGPLYTRGITFADYHEEAILSAKYIFFLDASSANFPKVKIRSELDIRKELTPPLFESFLLQAENAEKAFYVSYVNRDLKSDEEFYPSSFLVTLEQYFHLEHHEHTINIDETRSYDTLFTKKEFKDKDYFNDLLSMKDETDILHEEDDSEDEYDGKITLSNIKNYLTEPLKYKASRQFGRNADVYEKTQNEFEPFSLDSLTRSNMTSSIIASFLHEKREYIENADKEAYKRGFEIMHSLPDINEDIKDKEFNRMIDDCQKVIDGVNHVSHLNYEIIRLPDLRLKDEKEEWVLLCDNEFCRFIDQSTRYYFVLKPISNDRHASADKFLYVYPAALMDIASQESPYFFHIILKFGESQREFDVDKETAIHTLNMIHRHMMNHDNRCYPIVFFEKKDAKIDNLDSFYNELNGEHSPWNFFDYAKLFDASKLGYTRYQFKDEISLEKERISDEILFLHYEKMEENENGGE